MAYTTKQARAKAQQIFKRFGLLIHLACANSIVEESFLAGFVGVEAGIDREGKIKPDATRFEKHVFEKLKSVRDGLLRSYNKITRGDIEDASDHALRNLARSYGLTQIMGWHCIKNLKCSISELRDPEKHLFYTVELLILTGGAHLKNHNYGNVLRIWNTGSANGKTYHDDYVENALRVKAEYEEILKENKDAFKNALLTDQDDSSDAAVIPLVAETDKTEPAPTTANLTGDNAPGANVAASAGMGPTDDAIQVSTGTKKTLWATIVATAMGILTAIKGYAADNTILIAVGIVCATAVILALIFRTVIMDYVRMQLFGDPNKYNAK